ncbi:LysR family transcriptional regulator [Serratia ureilytica]|uniref:LysR family transcriptional regulator n=1 Tax=Serratia ureilytica TaxID=300181 RepID=UPI00313B714F
MSNILKRMAIFSKVVDCGAFSMAAKELGMTTSAVSQHIRQLEEHLGIQLLLRSTRSLSLTEAGLCFYEDCLLMIHAAERGQQRIAALRGELVVNCASPPRPNSPPIIWCRRCRASSTNTRASRCGWKSTMRE